MCYELAYSRKAEVLLVACVFGAFFFFCGSNVYLKLTEEYCFCVVKNLNTHVEII